MHVKLIGATPIYCTTEEFAQLDTLPVYASDDYCYRNLITKDC